MAARVEASGTMGQKPPHRIRSPGPKEMENMKQMLHSISDCGASPSVRPSLKKRTMSLIVAVTVALVVCLGASIFIGSYLAKESGICGTPACMAYNQLLRSSINDDVDPCQDFYGHVCYGWTRRQSRSVQQEAFRVFEDAVATAAAQVSVSDSAPQLPYHKAARLYQTCASSEGSESELRQFREMMRDSGVSWPYPSNDTDVLKPLFKLPTLTYIDSVLAVHLTDGLRGRPTILFQPSDCCGALFATRKSGDYERYFLEARSLMADAGDQDRTTFQELQAMEGEIVPLLSEALNGPKETWQGDAVEAVSLAIGIATERWKQALSVFLQLPPQVAPGVKISNVKFFRAFFSVAAAVGEAKMHAYVSWFFVQSILAFTSRTRCNAGRLTKKLGGDEKRKGVQDFCLAVVHRLMGYAMYQEYIADLATASNVKDVTSIIRDVREGFSVVFRNSPWYNGTAASQVSQWGTDPALEFLDKSKSERVELSYGSYSAMRRKFTVNWMNAHQALSRSSRDDVVPPLFLADEIPVLYALKEGSKNFVLMPYALNLPFYDLQAPFPVRYGALGSVVASALGAAAVFTGDSVEHRKAVHCVFGQGKSLASLSPRERDVLYSASTLGALWEAFQSNSRKHGSAFLRFGRRKWSPYEEKMFFAVWCYIRCGARGESSESCNVPLRHAPSFLRTYNCPGSSPMAAKPTCTIFPK